MQLKLKIETNYTKILSFRESEDLLNSLDKL